MFENTMLDLDAIAKRWWLLLVRGGAAVAFGVLAIIWPSASLFALVMLWGAFTLADGVTSVVLAVRAGHAQRRWGWLLFEGVVGIGTAVLTVLWPQITALALLVLIALWAILIGIAKIVTAVELRRVIRGEWLLAVSGLVSIAFGVLMMVFPGAGALTVITIIGAYALLFGALSIVLGFRIRGLAKAAEVPLVGGTPRPA